jgi:hypothetical protein
MLPQTGFGCSAGGTGPGAWTLYPSMPDDPATESNIIAALAVVVCREIYTLAGGAVGMWQAVYEVQDRLKVTHGEAQEALRYAVEKGWLNGFGTPMVSVMLLEPGRALFAGQAALPREPHS